MNEQAVAVLIVLVFALSMPALAILSINVLFGLTIPLTLKTYLSALCLGMFLRGNVQSNKK